MQPPPQPPTTEHLSAEWHSINIASTTEMLTMERRELNALLKENYATLTTYNEQLEKASSTFNTLLSSHLQKVLEGDSQIERNNSLRKESKRLERKLSKVKKEHYSTYLCTSLLPLTSYWAQLPDYQKFPQSVSIMGDQDDVNGDGNGNGNGCCSIQISKKTISFMEEISHYPSELIQSALIVYLHLYRKCSKIQMSKMAQLTCQIYNDSLFLSEWLNDDLTFLLKEDLFRMFEAETLALKQKYLNDNVLYSIVRLGGSIDEAGVGALGRIVLSSFGDIVNFLQKIKGMGEEVYVEMVGEQLVGGLLLKWLLRELMGEGCRIEFSNNQALLSLASKLINPLIEEINAHFPSEQRWGPLLKERMHVLDAGIRRISGMTLGQCCNAYRREEFEDVLSNQQLSQICRSFYPSNALREAFMEELEID